MFLGLDLGTTNIKAVLAEPDGRIAARGSAPVQTFHGDAGGVEQDIDDIFAATLSAVAAVTEGADAAVKAVGISSQGGALQMLDGEDRPVGRVISWLDGRGKGYDERITREMGRDALAARTGHPRGTMALGQLLRLKAESPELLAGANRIGLVGDLIVGRLCGRRAHDGTSLSCAVLYNPSQGSADAEMLRRVGIRADQLPPLLSPRETAGGLLREVAAKTRLPAGIPVGPAVHDQYAAALGCGATTAGDVMFGAGTAWVLLAISDRLMRPLTDAGFVCGHVAEGLSGHIISMGNGGSAVSWAKGLLGLGGAGGAEIDEMLAEVGPGSEGVRFWPFLAPTGGAQLPGGLTGRLWGLRLGQEARHVLRAVVEGLALELARYLGLLAEAGEKVERLIMCGGAAASRVTPQIVADATALPVACSAEPDTSALGAAILARGLLAPGRRLADISREMAPPVRTFQPGEDAAAYRQLFQEYLDSLPRP